MNNGIKAEMAVNSLIKKNYMCSLDRNNAINEVFKILEEYQNREKNLDSSNFSEQVKK